MRLGSWLLVVVVLTLLAPGAAAAQQTPPSTSTTSIVIGDELELSIITSVSMGIRRGVRELEGVRYRHLSDLVERPDRPIELTDAEDALEAVAEEIRSGSPSQGGQRAADAVAVFEENLALVRRRDLVDAYMLQALGHCRRRHGEAECVQGFERIVTFRESAEYDLDRYPEEFAQLFDETRDQLVENGYRGSVEIVTDPPGAEVFVDGRSMGASPMLAEGLLVGDHYITVKAQGYEEHVQRITVEESFQATVEVPLYEGERVRLIDEKIPQIREELGVERAGPAIQALDPLLGAARQVLFCVVEAQGDQLGLHMYVYDLRTNHLMRSIEGSVGLGEEGIDQVQRLATELYENVDLTGQVEAPEDDTGLGGGPIYEQWWFWASAGAVIAAGIILTLVVTGQENTGCPENQTCFVASLE